ncbi:MAG: hypothetical protein K0U52_10495 [Gammaproteobacteria bacterium]|nr:hypothetical protein [Gammaproteobacteria bacterium]
MRKTPQIRMRDRVTITRDSNNTASPNGDITSAFTTVGTYWCHAKNTNNQLSSRDYNAPQIDADYVITLRKETFTLSGIQKGDLASIEGVDGSYQVNDFVEENLRTYRVSLSATV